MKKSKITKRLSMKVKFKSMDLVELQIMDDKNNIQVEVIPVRLGINQDEEENNKEEVK